MTQPIIIDFELRPDGFWIIVQNISGDPVKSFTAVFEQPVLGMQLRGKPPGTRDVISDYELFKNCKYLAPGKKIELFVENETAFYSANPPDLKIDITVTDINNQINKYQVEHNLKIYQQPIRTGIINR